MQNLPRLRVRKKKKVLEPVSNQKRCNTYGSIDGVVVGTEWLTRKECSGAGVHKPTTTPIHLGPEGAYSVIISGRLKVKDDGDSLVFTGKYKTKNVSWSDNWTTALERSVRSELPVRVVRSSTLNNPYAPKSGFRYDGLYKVTKWWEDRVGVRFRYRMLRLVEQAPPTWGSLLQSSTKPNDSDSEEPRIVNSWHIRIQGEPRPAPAPPVEDIKPKVERINPLFAITGSLPDFEEIVLSEEEVEISFQNTCNKPTKSEQVQDCFVDVDNLSTCTERVEEITEWSVQEPSPTPSDSCVYEDYIESKEVKIDINSVQEEGVLEEEDTLGEPPLSSVELAHVNLDNSVCDSLPVIHNTLSFAKNPSHLLFDTDNRSTVFTDRGHSYICEGNFIIFNNLSTIPENEWEEQNEGIVIPDEDPLCSPDESPIAFSPTNKVLSEKRSSLEKEEMSDSDIKSVNQMEHKCFFDISLRDIVKMVTEMAGCPCSWTNKQQMSVSQNQSKPLLPPLLLDYLKTILTMAEGAGSGVDPNVITSNEGQDETRSYQVKEVPVPPPSPIPSLPKPITSTSLPALSIPPPSPSSPSLSNTSLPSTILPNTPLPPVGETNIDSCDSSIIPSVSAVSVSTNTDSEQNMCGVEHSDIGTNTNMVCLMSTSTMTDPPEEISPPLNPVLEPCVDKGVQTDSLQPSDECHVSQLSSELIDTDLSTEHQNQTVELVDPDETLDVKGKQRRKSKNYNSSEWLTEDHPPLKKGKIACKINTKLNCNDEGPSKTKEECPPVINNSHNESEIELKPFLNFEEEWAQPHLYKVNISKSFDEICDELCKTLPENGERSRKKGNSSFASRQNVNNHLQLVSQKRHYTVKKRRKKMGFVGFTESQQRLSKMKTSMMYGFYIDNCNFRGWSQECEKSFISDSHLNFDL